MQQFLWLMDWMAILTEAFCAFLVLRSSFSAIRNSLKWVGFFATAMAYSAAQCFTVDWHTIGRAGVLICIWLVYACAAYQGSFLQKMLCVCAFFAVLCGLDYSIAFFEMMIGGGQAEGLFHSDNGILIATFFSRTILLGISILYDRFRMQKRRQTALSSPVALALLIVPLYSVFCYCVVLEWAISVGEISAGMTLLCAGLLGINILFVILEEYMESGMELKRQNLILQQQSAYDRRRAESLQQLFRSQRTQTHDYRNQLTVLSTLLQYGTNQEALAYLERLKIKANEYEPVVHTNHPVVDAVLNLKYKQANEQNIAMRFVVNDLSKIILSDADLVVVLGNLLDNALEASRMLAQHREIDVKLLVTDQQMLLSVRNTYSEELKSEADESCASMHGFGLKTVEAILDRYHIAYSVTSECGWFQFTAMQ